ncbi:MAG: hypothetical protein ACI9Y7_001447 [Dokdonia sp.]|jgi:hypothetical protein
MKNLYTFLAFYLICTLFSLHSQTISNLSFDGLNDYIEAPSTALDIIGNQDFTFEAWVRGDESSQTTHPTIFSNRPTSASGCIFFFHDIHSDSIYKMLCVQLNGVNYILFNNGTYNGSLLDGECHHVAITKQGNLISFYADGAFIGTRGYFGSICASDFGVMMPVISDQTVPIFTF